jgi:uncharacterized membrane protein
MWGGLVGLAMYGIFNSVNYAIFDNYTFDSATKDFVWGVVLCVLATMAGAYASEHVLFYKMFSAKKDSD